MAKRGLGKGLSSLIPQTEAGQDQREVTIDQIDPNPWQPRQEFPQEALKELADSIRQHGVLQPVLVVPAQEDRYQLIAGERRLRAARMAGLKTIPVVVGNFTSRQQLEIALVENLQRQDLDPLEEAEAYRRLMDEFGYTQEQLGNQLGKSRSYIANALRLLHLDSRVKNALKEKKLSVGHARTLLTIATGERQWQEAQKIMEQKLNVRQSEDRARTKQQKKEKEESINPFVKDMADRLREALGTRISIKNLPGGKGKIEIDFYSREDLDRLMEMILNNVSRETRS